MTIFPLLLHYFRLLSRTESCNFKFGKFSLITLNVDCGPPTVLSAMTDAVLFNRFVLLFELYDFFLIGFYFYEHKRGVPVCRKSLLKS